MSTAHLTKTATRFEVKEMNDEARTFTGLASTWEMDLGGDVIRKGAFKGTLKTWRESGKVLPLLDSHRSGVEDVIGKLVEAKETDAGLLCTFALMQGDAKADAVYRRIKDGYVDGLSIGYEPRVWERPDEDAKKTGVWRILKEVNLMEVSVVLWPMNTGARIADVKTLADQVNPERMTEEDFRIARAVASHIGAILRHAPAPKGKGEDSDPESETPESQEGTVEDEGQPTAVPEAPPEETPSSEADATEGKKHEAPLFIREAVLERIQRVKSQRIETEENDHE